MTDVIPRSRGGKTNFAGDCDGLQGMQRAQGRQDAAEAGMRMYFKPYTPRTIPLGQPLLMSLDSIPGALERLPDGPRFENVTERSTI